MAGLTEWTQTHSFKEFLELLEATVKRDPADQVADVAKALAVLAQCNIPVDVQELLILGNPERDIAPNALGKAIEEVFGFYAVAYREARP